MSFLEMIDQLNEKLILDGKEPVAFDHDCREGICGSCSMMIDGRAHGPEARGHNLPIAHAQLSGTATTIYDRTVAGQGLSPIIKDLIVDRTAFDRIIESGGYRWREYWRGTGRKLSAHSRLPDSGSRDGRGR